MQNHIPRLLLSATGSDSGKTTVMLALLSAFQKSGVVVQSYKSGPDYIDPMFHEAVTHRPAYHTDPFFLQSDAMKKLVAATAQQADLALIEGQWAFMTASDRLPKPVPTPFRSGWKHQRYWL